MLRNTEFHRLARRLNGVLLTRYLDEDRWRLQNSFFGLKVRSEDPHSVTVFFGARSGLEIVRLLTSSPTMKIVLVEPHEGLRQEILTSLARVQGLDWQSQVIFCSSADELAHAIPERRIGMVRVDLAAFDWGMVARLIESFEVGHIAGEFDPYDADPMVVYRGCRGRVQSFFWRISGHSTPISFNGPKATYEVSVIVPAYKVLPWIDRCMGTLADQTLQSMEIIAVDDGSPDATGARLDEWAEKYPGRIKVIHKQNGGCASARNAGIAHATGEYVAFVDGDDWVDVNMFEQLYQSAVLNAADVSQCGYIEAFEDSGRFEAYPTAAGGSSVDGKSGLVWNPRTFLAVKPTIWRRIYKRAFLSDNGISFPEHIRRFDDLPFQFEVLARVKRMSIIPDCYYYYRQEREGQDISVTDHRLFVHFPIFEWLNEKVGVWADGEIESYLLKCKINTHLFALSRLDKKFVRLYVAHAAHDVCGGRVRLKLRDTFRIVRSGGLPALHFMAGCFFFLNTKRPKMIPCD